MIITILFFIIFLISIHHIYLHYGKRGRLINRIPGPTPLPILGNLLHFFIPQDKLLSTICKLQARYYPIAKIWICHVPGIGLSHPDDNEAILSSTKQIEKGTIYIPLYPWLRTGLLTSGGSKWHTRRKILTPTFHFYILKQFVEIFIEESNHMVTILKDARGPVVKELLPFVSEHTLNVICESAMGISLKNSTESQQYREAIHQIGEVIFYRLIRMLYREWITALLPIGRKQRKLLSMLHSFTEKIIADRKEYHKRTGGQYLKNIKNDISAQDDTEIIGSKKRRLAMLDLLIAVSQENNISDSDIKEEVDTFTFEGHDTVAMGICFALMLLAEHKDVQDRVRLEVNTMIEKNGGKFTMSLLQNLPYLDRCVKEILRLYPSVPFISRITTEDIKLQSYTVPSNVDVYVNIYATHRNPNFWPNPEVFDPDRFLPERSKNRHPYSYIPFSAGPRNCIGQRYAFLELKAVIASLIHNFYLEPIDYLKDVEVTIDIVLRPTRPVHVKFVPIESS